VFSAFIGVIGGSTAVYRINWRSPNMQRYFLTFTLSLSLFICSPAIAWHDATHMAVMKAAGLDNYAYLAVGADMAKEKAGGYEDGNHYRNNAKGVIVTADMVLDQVR